MAARTEHSAKAKKADSTPAKKASAPTSARSAEKEERRPKAEKVEKAEKAAKSTRGAPKSSAPASVPPPRSSKSGKSVPPPRPTRAPASSTRMPLSPKPKQKSIEERTAEAEERLQRQDEAFRAAYQARFDMSWIYHDSALEGSVYNELELRTALDPEATIVPESSLQPICEEIRRHREAIHYCREMAMKKRQPVTVDTFKKIYLILHPEEGDLKTVKYRKDIPQHRLYFHEYGAPDKIATKVRQAIDWLNDPEARKGRSPLRMAARVHYDLIRIFPFPQNSGKTARLFMNLLLMRAGYPPAIIHSTERQRYYEALKGSAITINAMVLEALDNALASIEKLLDEHETKTRAFIA
jgi:Fic family protein